MQGDIMYEPNEYKKFLLVLLRIVIFYVSRAYLVRMQSHKCVQGFPII